MKRLGIYIAVLLVALIGLSFWLGNSAELQVQQLLEQSSSQLSPEYKMEYGEVSVSTFAGNINISSLSFAHTQQDSRYSLDNLELDLTYIDFLRVYLKGVEQGLSEMKGMQINLTAPAVQIDSILVEAAEWDLYHRGPVEETLAAIFNQKRPSNAIFIESEASELHFSTQYTPLQEVILEIDYDPALQNLSLRQLQIDDPKWGGYLRGSIRMNAASTSFTDWAEIALDYSIQKSQAPDQELYLSDDIGQLLGAEINLTGNFRLEDCTPKEFWIRFPFQIRGSHRLTAQTLSWKPSANLTEQYMPLMALKTAQPNGIRIDQVDISLVRTLRTNRLQIDNFEVKTPMLALTGQGALQLYPGDFLAARFVETELKAHQFSAGMSQLIKGAARFFNIQNADRDSYKLRVTGPLRSPQVLPME